MRKMEQLFTRSANRASITLDAASADRILPSVQTTTSTTASTYPAPRRSKSGILLRGPAAMVKIKMEDSATKSARTTTKEWVLFAGERTQVDGLAVAWAQQPAHRFVLPSFSIKFRVLEK